MEHIVDIAKQNLDTYKAELASAGVLYNLSEQDYKQALDNLEQLVRELKEFME